MLPPIIALPTGLPVGSAHIFLASGEIENARTLSILLQHVLKQRIVAETR